MSQNRYYSSTALPTALNANISSSTNSIQVLSIAGMPTSYPFTLLVEWGTGNQDIITVTQAASSGSGYWQFDNCLRNVDGVTGVSHLAGASVVHGVSARDYNEPQVHLGNNALHNQPWSPSDQGLLAANTAVPDIANAGTVVITGTLYLMKLWLRESVTVSNVVLADTTIGSGLTTTGSFAGLWNSAGTLLSGSSDIITNSYMTPAGFSTIPLTTPQAITAGNFVWAGVLFNFSAGSGPLFIKVSTSVAMMNAGLTAATYGVACYTTYGTTLANITPANNATNITNAIQYWAGLS